MGGDQLRHAFQLLAAVELGRWPSWDGPRPTPELRHRVEALAVLFDILPACELSVLDAIVASWAASFPRCDPVPLEQLRELVHQQLLAASAEAAASAGTSATGRGVDSSAEAATAQQLDAMLAEWKRRVTGERHWTHLPAIVPGEPPARIDEIYVELYAVAEHDLSEEFNADSERATRVSRRLLSARQPVVGVPTLVARTLERCIVVGEPGCGKSTLLRWLAHATYRGMIADYERALFIKLSTYAAAIQKRAGLTLLEYFFASLVPAGVDVTAAADLLRRRTAASRRDLLLLDGWDEVPLALREEVRDRILAESSHFVTIITSRPSGLPRELRDGGRVEFYRIAGLTPRSTEDLTRRLLRPLGRPGLAETVLRRLREEADLREMAANPFLLGLLVRVLAQASSEAVPRSLANVYHQIIAWIQEQVNRLRDSDGPLAADHLAVLERLSYRLLYSSDLPSYVFHRRHLDAALAGGSISENPIYRSRFIDRTDPIVDEFCFVHATLQEYFAASQAAALPADALDRFVEQSFWSASRLVVLEFAAGIEGVAETCRRKAETWFDGRDRFHHVLLRLARVAAAGRWRGDGLCKAIRQQLWRIIEAKEYALTTTAAIQAFAELDPVDLVNHAAAAAGLDFLLVRNILSAVPRTAFGLEVFEGMLEGPWHDFTSLVVVAASDAELETVRRTLQDPLATAEARTAAVRIAGMSQDALAVPALLAMLQTDFPDAEARKEAVDSLGRIGGRKAVDSLIGLLVDDGGQEELAGCASAALSIRGSAALDPAGRDRLVRQLAARDPASKPIADILYALLDYPIRVGADVIADIAGQTDLPPDLRIAAVQVVASATSYATLQRLASAATLEGHDMVRQALCRLAMDRSVRLPEDWLEARITEEASDSARTLWLATYLLQAARAPVSRRSRYRKFIHLLIEAALAEGAPDPLASSLSKALTQPDPRDSLLAEETLTLARGILDAFVDARGRSTVDQVVLAVNVIRHFPDRDPGKVLGAVLDAALDRARSSESEPERQGWDRLAGYVAALLANVAPGELLRYPAGCDLVDNALREVSVARGWFVFPDRILDAEGRPIASTDSISSAGQVAASAGLDNRSSAEPLADASGEAPAATSGPSERGVVSGNAGMPTTPEPPGIECMGEEVAEMLGLLIEFRRIGQVCRQQGKDGKFAIGRIAAALVVSESKVRDKLDGISMFFRRYFENHEQLVVPADDDESLSPEEAVRRKLFERVQGRTFRIYPLGWRAWELTCRYLNRVAPLPQSDA